MVSKTRINRPNFKFYNLLVLDTGVLSISLDHTAQCLPTLTEGWGRKSEKGKMEEQGQGSNLGIASNACTAEYTAGIHLPHLR